uniref:Uncharacterized protein n=1 Tax=Anguilla anguilla TaxID=7936 RepID=A0A0E9SHN9_ANGAN
MCPVLFGSQLLSHSSVPTSSGFSK